MVNYYIAHENLLKKFDKAVTLKFPKVIVLPYTVGVFRDFETSTRIIRAGVKGVPDRLVLLSTGGYLFFDAKTGNATFSKEQRAFKARIEYCTDTVRVFKLKNVDDALRIIEDYEKGIPVRLST